MNGLPVNRFKARLKAGEQQIGLWSALGGPSAFEALAGVGFDWVVIDTEHAPTDVPDVLPALQAMAAFPETAPVVRPTWNDPVTIKRLLDFGAQTLLIPYVQSPAEAEAAVRACRYPPAGIRGVAGGSRASGYGQIADYPARANDEICVLVQVETAEAINQLEAIATVEGVDGVFIGPSDLAASMGFPGNPGHPEVTACIEDAIGRLKSCGVPAGILTLNREFAARCIALGTGFTAVGIDMNLLLDGAKSLRRAFTPS